MFLGLIKATHTRFLQRLPDFFSNVMVNVDLERKIRWKVQTFIYPGWRPAYFWKQASKMTEYENNMPRLCSVLAELCHLRSVNVLIFLFFNRTWQKVKFCFVIFQNLKGSSTNTCRNVTSCHTKMCFLPLLDSDYRQLSVTLTSLQAVGWMNFS